MDGRMRCKRHIVLSLSLSFPASHRIDGGTVTTSRSFDRESCMNLVKFLSVRRWWTCQTFATRTALGGPAPAFEGRRSQGFTFTFTASLHPNISPGSHPGIPGCPAAGGSNACDCDFESH